MTVSNFATIEDPLGADSERFFGSGYKRVDRELSELTIVAPGKAPGAIRGFASLQYPADWSKKTSHKDLQPHLSTVDGLLLAIDLAEAYLTHTYGFDKRDRRRMWVRRFTVRADTRPCENLQHFTVSAIAVGRALKTGNGSYVSTFDCRISELKVVCDIEHGHPRAMPGAGYFGMSQHVLGLPEKRHYGKGYQQRSIRVNDLVLDDADRHIQAAVSTEPARRDKLGMEGAYRSSISMLDALLTLAQLAQVLVYECDGVERAESNTLWMRRSTLARQSPRRPSAVSAQAVAAIESSRLLRLNGSTWRTFEVVGQFKGLCGRASLAHQLPGGVLPDEHRSTRSNDLLEGAAS